MNLVNIILILGAIGIIIPRVRRSGLIAGIIFSILPIIGLVIAMLVLASLWGMINMAAYNYDKGPEREEEAWRQEQIATTGSDPCEPIYATERETRRIHELSQAGELDQGDIMTRPLTNNFYPSENMTWEQKDAYLAHRWELQDKCPPLNYVESLNTESANP